MDRDGSGAVSYDELKQLLGRFNIHMSDAQFNEMILKIDENSDGEITYTELMSYFRKNQVDTAQGMIERVRQSPARNSFSQLLTEMRCTFRKWTNQGSETRIRVAGERDER